jgi:Fic family protein
VIAVCDQRGLSSRRPARLRTSAASQSPANPIAPASTRASRRVWMGAYAPRARIEALIAEKTTPENRSEQEIAGYRDVLALIHTNRAEIPFEPRYVEQLHGTLHKYVGVRDSGHWKRIDNEVSEVRPDGAKVVRFTPVSAALTPQAMQDLHRDFAGALQADTYSPLLLCAAYVLDFTVIHPFRDGNGRMSRLITLWLLYIVGHDVGRYISIEQLIYSSRETYYEALRRSTEGWHDSEHDLAPWTGYFLGILTAAYRELESRTGALGGRGSKKALITAFIDSLLTDEFTVSAVRENAPGVSDAHISKVLAELKQAGIIEPLGTGRGARWRRLRGPTESS